MTRIIHTNLDGIHTTHKPAHSLRDHCEIHQVKLQRHHTPRRTRNVGATDAYKKKEGGNKKKGEKKKRGKQPSISRRACLAGLYKYLHTYIYIHTHTFIHMNVYKYMSMHNPQAQ